MLAKCANPGCNHQFRYLREGQLVVFHGPHCSSNETRFWWLCADCAARMALHVGADNGVHVAPKTRFEKHECSRCLSLYREGLVESYCNRCGRFLGASSRELALSAAEEAHKCAASPRGFDQVEMDIVRADRIGT